MSYIQGYVLWKVTKLESVPDSKIRVTILTEDTKEEIKCILETDRICIGTWEEIEIITYGNDVLATHNITRWIKKRAIDTILFPTEIWQVTTEKEYFDKRLQMMHTLIWKQERMKQLYDKYKYLTEEWWDIRWARDPNVHTFENTKSFMENARNIIFFYYVVRTRVNIIITHEEMIDEWGIDEGLFGDFKKEYYDEFIGLVGKIPLSYQTFDEFSNYIEEIRDQVGL